MGGAEVGLAGKLTAELTVPTFGFGGAAVGVGGGHGKLRWGWGSRR
jgi:hypothetical protein